MNIIVAEDHPVSAKLFEKFLIRAGHTVFLASDGEEAWQLLQEHKARIVLTDWMMPKLDGLSLCKKIREKMPTPYIYLILLTAKDAPKDMLSAFRAGVDDYIAKPVNPEELMARIRVGLRHIAMEDRHAKTLRQLMHTERFIAFDQFTKNLRREITSSCEELSDQINSLYQKRKDLKNIKDEFKREEIENLSSIYKKLTENIKQGLNILDSSQKQIETARKLIDSTKVFTDPETIEFKLYDIHECMESSLARLKDKFETRIKLIKSIEKTPPIFCFPKQIEQIFYNVLLNSIEAIEGEGEIFIELKKEEEDNNIRIYVHDTGGGIAPEIMEKVFEPFFTTHKKSKGRGLGLHAANIFIQAHEGKIKIESSKHGTSVSIFIPLENININMNIYE